MFEIVSTFGDNILAIRHRGPVTDSEFLALAEMVADLPGRGDLLLFLDWVGIKDWAFSAPGGDALIAWRRAAKAIRRIAIVHDPRLNRPAAWLGAVMRQEGVIVRSWRPQHALLAATWLQTDVS
ncbi:STAS/SEC14 domain-containing protein [Rhizobium sp. F40D2]|uniref:STAS/SEC14 domain-containing protein n=1 Tax=Rhizobium sp. F40D2 TaxID=3453141 RepID=UPI003F2197E0